MALRHFGLYRAVTPEQAKLDKAAVKALFRWGSLQASVLAARCHVTVESEEWALAMSRLAEYRIVEKVERRKSSFFALTGVGQDWGCELCCEEQIAESDWAEAERLAALNAERG